MHMQDKQPGCAVSRRGFLKTAAATGGAAMAASGSGLVALAEPQTESASVERTFVGACRGNCCGGCPLDITVRDGFVVRTTYHELPDPEYNRRVCLKGLSHAQRMYDGNRLRYPLRRVDGTERGAGQWERISWDEAIGEVSTRLSDILAKYGPGSILRAGVGGNFASIQTQMVCNSWFAHELQMCHLSTAVDNVLINASVMAMGASASYSANELNDMANARTIIAWGADIADSYIQAWRWIADAQANGAKLIVIDPIFTTLASKADIYVPVRPASDAALAMAMINVCMEEGLVDVPFVRNSTVGPFLVRADNGMYLRGTDCGLETDGYMVIDADGTVKPLVEAAEPVLEGSVDVEGIACSTAYSLLTERVAPWTPEYAESVCDVPAATIRTVARIYAKQTPGTIFPGYGVDHYTNGQYSLFSIMALAMVTGNLGKKGATCGLVMPLPQNWSDDTFIYGLVDSYMWGAVYNYNLHETMTSGQFQGREVHIKALWAQTGNVIGNGVNRSHIVNDCIPLFEFIVGVDMIMSDTCQYADIVLPAAHWFEVEDVFGAYSPQPYLVIQEKAAEPYCEAKSDLEICQLVADAMGRGKKVQGMVPADFANLLMNCPAGQAQGLTYGRLQKEKVIRLFPKGSIHGEGGVFPTATGRAQFYQETPAVLADCGQELVGYDEARLPVKFQEPAEAWELAENRKIYPFSVIQQHAKWRTHTMFGHIPWLRELDPEPVAKMNPGDCAKKGIADGDYVRVFNGRGEVVLKAVYSAGIRPGVIDIPKGWQKGQFKKGHYQELTSFDFDPLYVNSPFYDIAVDVEKWEGSVE